MQAFDADAGVADMLDDFHQGQFDEGREKEDIARLFFIGFGNLTVHCHVCIEDGAGLLV